MTSTITKKQKYIVLAALFITWIVNYLDKFSMNVAIIPISEEFNLNPSQAGLVISAFFVSYAIMQLIGGFLSDKYGARLVILVSVFLWSIFTVITGFTWSLLSLIAIRFLFGLAEGSFPAASTLAVADYFPREERGRAKSVLSAATTVGAIVSTILAAVLITSIGWRNLFILFGILGIFLTLVLYFVLKEPASSTNNEKVKKNKVPLKLLVKVPMLWPLMIIYFGVNTVNWGLTSWMPTYMVKVKNLDMLQMGVLAIFPALGALFAALLAGYLVDKLGAGKEKFIIIFGSFIAALSLFFMTTVDSIATVIVFQTITTAGAFLASTTILTLPLKYFSHEIIGTATGIIYFGGQLAGAVSPYVMGLIITIFNGSYNAAFLFLIGMIVFAALLAFKLKTVDSSQSIMSTQN